MLAFACVRYKSLTFLTNYANLMSAYNEKRGDRNTTPHRRTSGVRLCGISTFSEECGLCAKFAIE